MKNTVSLQSLRLWLKQGEHPLAAFLYKCIIAIRTVDFPAPKIIYSPLFFILHIVTSMLAYIMRMIFWTPLFKSRLATIGKNLYLYGGMPFMSGSLTVHVGNNCRVSGKITISGRTASESIPKLELGNNIDLGWMTTIAVGTRIIIADNVRIAGQCFLAGYPGHPVDATARAQGLPDTDDQIGDIVLERDVWLATGVSVMAGVTIGEGTIVAAGSVVTRDIPSYVLAAGCPAKVVRSLIPTSTLVPAVKGNAFSDSVIDKGKNDES